MRQKRRVKMFEIKQLTEAQYEILVNMAYGWCYPFSHFNGTKKELRKEFKILREAELVEFHTGLMTEEGFTAGSGYCKNHRKLEEIDKLIEDYEKSILEKAEKESKDV
jgi:hypothetical protein